MDFIFTYRRWLFLSSLVHVVLILFILLFNKASFMRPVLMMSAGGMGSAISVDVVGLPNILKKDIETFSQAADEKAKPDDMVLRDKEKISSEKKSLIQKLRRSLSSESTYLKKVAVIKGLKRSEPGKATGVGTGTGTGQGTGSGEGSTDSAQLQANPYFNTVKELIRSYWQVPTWMNAEGLNTQITIKIGINGELSDIQITKPSGNSDFDKLAYQAVRDSAPFTPPPLAVKDLVQNGVVLSFP